MLFTFWYFVDRKNDTDSFECIHRESNSIWPGRFANELDICGIETTTITDVDASIDAHSDNRDDNHDVSKEMRHCEKFYLPHEDKGYINGHADQEEPPSAHLSASFARIGISWVRSDALNDAIFSTDLWGDEVDVGAYESELTRK